MENENNKSSLHDVTGNNANVKLSKINNVNSDASLNVIKDRKELMEFFTDFVKNKNIGVNTPEEALGVYMACQELGIGFSMGVNHVHVIRGKTGIDVHIAKALLLRQDNIKWTKTLDFVGVYKYTSGNAGDIWVSHLKPTDFINWLRDEDPYYEKAIYAPTKERFTEAKANGFIPIVCASSDGKLTPFDYKTEYVFERVKMFNGKPYIQREVSSFSVSEAIQSGKYKPGEDSAWNAYLQVMVDHRAWFFGARAIADDLLMGAYSVQELLEINDIKYNINQEGEIIDANVTIIEESDDVTSTQNNNGSEVTTSNV